MKIAYFIGHNSALKAELCFFMNILQAYLSLILNIIIYNSACYWHQFSFIVISGRRKHFPVVEYRKLNPKYIQEVMGYFKIKKGMVWHRDQ